MAKKPKVEKVETFKCGFCKEKFLTEKRMYDHLCKPKRLYQQRETKDVKLGFALFQHFCKKRANKSQPSIEAFEKSSVYSGFVGFANYLKNINAISPMSYLDFLLASNVGINHWKNPIYYERYIRELNKLETPMEAMERNILLMQQWSIETGEPWTDFFKKVAPAKAILWIKSGRISPWMLFSVPASKEMFDRFSEEQLKLVNDIIDAKYWELKLERNLEQVLHIKNTFEEIGL